MSTTGITSRSTGAEGRPPAADKDPKDRPGVPFYQPSDLARRPPLDQQEQTVPVLVGVEVGRLTPVFGTASPPRGLSGLLRRAAYRIPEHAPSHWMLLLLGDRVDVWEGRVRRHPLATVAIAAAAVAVIRRRRARRMPRLRKLRALFG
jgi:hypothetical protein